MNAFKAKIPLLQIKKRKKMPRLKKSVLNFLIPIFSIPLFAQEILLPSITTYIDNTVVEQKTVITAEEIQEKHVDSLTSLLQSEGIQVLAYGAYGLQQAPSIRGFTDETVRVVIDGVCVNNAQYGTFDFSSININDIEKLEIVRGGFTEGVCDEGAVGGVIYITTKKQQFGIHFNSDTQIKTFFNANNLFDTFCQSAGFSSSLGKSSFFKAGAKGAWANNRFLFKNYKGMQLERQNSQVKDANADIQFLHYFGNGNYFSASNLFYIGNKNVPGVENAAYSGVQDDLTNKMIFALNFPAIKDCVRLENSVAWICDTRKYLENEEAGAGAGSQSMGSGLSRHYVNSFKFSSSAVFFGWKNFTQSLGLNFDYTNLNSTNDGKHNQFTFTAKETSKIKLGQFFTLSVPFAVKICGENFAFIPKAGVTAEFSHINLIFDVYRMVQFPNMDDLYWTGGGFHGNADLKPEAGWGADFSVNVHNFIVPFSLCLFTNYYANKIQWDLSKGQPENLASAFYFGIDFSAEKTLFDFVTIKLNAEYLYNRLLDKNNSLTYGKRIMWTPDLTAAISTRFAFEYFTWSIDANYTGSRYTSNLNLYELEPYVLLNTSLEFTKIAWFTPYLRGENLLNTDYESAENYPMPGISLTVGIKFKR